VFKTVVVNAFEDPVLEGDSQDHQYVVEALYLPAAGLDPADPAGYLCSFVSDPAVLKKPPALAAADDRYYTYKGSITTADPANLGLGSKPVVILIEAETKEPSKFGYVQNFSIWSAPQKGLSLICLNRLDHKLFTFTNGIEDAEDGSREGGQVVFDGAPAQGAKQISGQMKTAYKRRRSKGGEIVPVTCNFQASLHHVDDWWPDSNAREALQHEVERELGAPGPRR
jgi:hypothetical protein